MEQAQEQIKWDAQLSKRGAEHFKLLIKDITVDDHRTYEMDPWKPLTVEHMMDDYFMIGFSFEMGGDLVPDPWIYIDRKKDGTFHVRCVDTQFSNSRGTDEGVSEYVSDFIVEMANRLNLRP